MNNKAPLEVVKNIPFIDLKTQQARIEGPIQEAIANVLNHGAYIMGPEVAELEKRLADFTGSQHCISCSSGTDALALVLMAKRIKPGDAIFVPSFTFAATAEVVAWLGAQAVFVDSDPHSFNMCPNDLERAIQWSNSKGFNAQGIITVDLFGLPADYDFISSIADANNLWIMDDAAQGLGGTYKGKKIGQFGEATATSFFPAKPLGCYGDGGAIFTDNEKLALSIKSLRVHGKGTDKYDNVNIGMNGRLDTLQAAILIEKLNIFEDELKVRNDIATRYNSALADYLQVPETPSHSESAWAQYTLLLPENIERNAVIDTLKSNGVPTAVYYPKPLHQQTAYKRFNRDNGNLPVCENLSQRVLSLPMHPYLDKDTQDYIIEQMKRALS